jgi:hypothetical protein
LLENLLPDRKHSFSLDSVSREPCEWSSEWMNALGHRSHTVIDIEIANDFAFDFVWVLDNALAQVRSETLDGIFLGVKNFIQVKKKF